MVKSASRPSAGAYSRRSRAPMAWNVPDQASASAVAPALGPRACAAMRSTRRCISAAARREKVRSMMRRGSAPQTTRCATRCASVLVLPVPAPAMMRSGGGAAGERAAVLDGAALLGVELVEVGGGHGAEPAVGRGEPRSSFAGSAVKPLMLCRIFQGAPNSPSHCTKHERGGLSIGLESGRPTVISAAGVA